MTDNRSLAVERDSVSLGTFEFECGRSIADLEVAYETYGEFTGDNAVLVCHALTGSQHVAGSGGDGTAGQAHAWWNDIVGPGKAVDTTEYYVVCANVPGSCYGTTGPPTENPETGEPYGTAFPAVTVTDWTECQRLLLDELGVPHLRLVTGGSVGGMNVLEWAKQHPDHVEQIAPIAAAARLDPQCLALDGVARRAITTDPDWQGGDYYGDTHPDDGLALARQLGHVMYLSKESMDRRFGRRGAGRDAARSFPTDPAGRFFPYRDVESYLDYQAETFVERFDANAYLYLTRAMERYDLAAAGSAATGTRASGPEADATADSPDDAAALSAFDGRALTLSVTSDWLFPPEQVRDLTASLRAAGVDTRHATVESDRGHDAFLVETAAVADALGPFLAEGTREERSATVGAPVHASLLS